MKDKAASKMATSKQLMRLIEKQEYRCALSGMILTPDVAALDHIVPVSEGGSDAIDNLQWVHEEINRMKGTMDNRSFIELSRKVARWNG